MGTRTPWGLSDSSTKLASGIIFYTTPGHGGYHLSPTRNAKVHSAWRRSGGWYEEDIDWAIVVLTFSHLFTFAPAKVEAAKETAKNWLPHQYMAVTGEILSPLESHKLREEQARSELANKWVAISAMGDWHPLVPKGKVAVIATLGGRGQQVVHTSQGWRSRPKPKERWFLVDADRYHPRQTPIGYVIDEVLDTHIDPLEG